MRFDNPLLVRWAYAGEERLAKRDQIFRFRATTRHVAFVAERAG